uniref:Putative LAGLIDADG homing endonuclease n=1 Tax=Jenufa perforata TaxID=993091 RepID=A0A0S2LNM3_9CHLO|nr:putative LAGLIDADG homing endonuclease [Jenufa perforata]ALO62915.1 putative LAGLIDADG homing endonuclease [Jenufa perforata]
MKQLGIIKLSDDYVLGVHYGDGSFYVGLSWKPTEKSHRLRCEPEWSISGDDETYWKAFSNTFDGRTCLVDKKGQRKFVLVGVKKCICVLDLFDKAPWINKYKFEQYVRWKKSINLIQIKNILLNKGLKSCLI